ncbi:alpha-ribazole phosphatase [Ralstonia chuxiongensis]|uniref:Alpha-ribazole phosphatase n=1 Tax=Ralstonia chuxiongensis TaxID=2957504 RepID=A0AA42BI10_9RALS|nr:alpha-ribazole phosphatase [Ralstonia chuxiongensis]MCP1173715.1 alpha-ribazole phosphatase [Ralstonia chuxiongensis]
MDVILIRHARPAMTAGLCYGRTDLELASPMDPEPSAIVEKLSAHTPHRLLASPLQRSRLTAEALAQTAQLPTIEIDAQLMELDFGAWEGSQWDDIPRAEIDQWARDLVHGNPHGGESAADLLARVTTWAEATSATPASCVWAVTHAGCMRALASHWLQRPLAETLQWPLQWGAACGFRVLPDALPVLLFWNR